MNSAQIKAFITVAQCMNVTEAAEKLFITQPSLSRQIMSLEEDLGIQLFYRCKKKLKLTPAGNVLIQSLPELIDQYSSILKEAKDANDGSSGALNIGHIEEQVINETIFKTLNFLNTNYPNIKINITKIAFKDYAMGLIGKRLTLP